MSRLFSPPVLKGPLTRNELLKNVFPELSAQILGAESFATHETFGTIYTGVKSGHILELKKNQSIHLRYGGEQHNCSGSYLDAVDCGRPLGLRFHKKNKDLLLIADAYYGLYEFNVVTGKHFLLANSNDLFSLNFNARPLRYLNDLDVMEDGETVILSEPSTTFSDRDYLYALMEHGGDGRLLAYNLVNGELKVLLDNLQYPNGVQLEQNGQCVLIAEMGNLQILRLVYCFNNSYTVAVGNLPGYPDNIRLTENGDLWVPMGGVRFTDDSWLTLRPYLLFTISFTNFTYVSPKYGLALIVDSHSGEIKKSFHDPTGVHVPSISQVRTLTIPLSQDLWFYVASKELGILQEQ
uniref:Str_synth domain-containing protein n=1 Tax=Syphacia muris TaxID=451379 RepID=A0A0N5AYH3_9BILA